MNIPCHDDFCTGCRIDEEIAVFIDIPCHAGKVRFTELTVTSCPSMHDKDRHSANTWLNPWRQTIS